MLGAGGGVDEDDGLPGFLKAAAAFFVNRTAVRRLTPAGEPLDELLPWPFIEPPSLAPTSTLTEESRR